MLALKIALAKFQQQEWTDGFGRVNAKQAPKFDEVE